MTRPGQLDAAIVAALFASAMAVGVLYCRAFERSNAPPEPWVKELSAAVAFACGHGFVDPGYEPSPAVAAFLEKRIDHVSCADLPDSTPMRPPNFTQTLYRYMTLSVGLTWRLAGISWTKLAPLLGLLYAASAIAVYGMFRLCTNRVLAVAGALIMTVSPIQLRYLPQLRDYAKAPFILTLILILGLLVVGRFTRRRLLALATAYGAVMGIGLGFRNDLLINVLPFMVTLALFLPVPIRSHLRTKLAALALCAVSFVACAWPIITAYRSGSNTGHVALLGLMTYFNAPLGVTGSVYDWGAPYDDGFAIKVISSFAGRVQLRSVSALSSEYDRATLEYLLLIGRHWPADLLIRGYASVLRVVELPFQVRSYTLAAPPAVVDGFIGWLYTVWAGTLSQFSGIGLALSAFPVLAVASSSIRVAIWLLAALLYFGGYPAVQFDARHFFFLEFIPWLAIGLTCESALAVLAEARTVRAGQVAASDLVIRGRRVLAFGLGSVLALGVPVVALRAYQQRHVTALLDSYLTTATEPLALSPIPIGGRRVLLRPNGLRQSAASQGLTDYLVVDITRRNCSRALAPITFRYETMSGYTDLSQDLYVPVPRTDAPFRLLFAAYYSPGQHFAGVEVIDGEEGCIASVRRVARVDSTPILLNLTLPPDWRQMALYQTLTGWERPSAPYRAHVYAWPADLPMASIEGAIDPISTDPVTRADIVRDLGAGAWSVDGYTQRQYSYLLEFGEAPIAAGAYFVIRGELEEGGFTVGLLEHGQWSTSVNVTQPGVFEAAMQIQRSGRYALTVANCLDTGWWQRGWRYRLRSRLGLAKVGPNRFRVTAAGWIPPTRHSNEPSLSSSKR